MDESQKTDEPTPSYNSSSRSTSGQVMDIQSPKPTSDTAPNLPSFPEELDTDVSESEGTSPTTATTPQVVTEATAEPSSSEPVQDAVAPETPAVAINNSNSVANDGSASQPGATTDQPADPDHNPLAIPPHASHKSGAPVIAIVVAIIVALGLAALVAFTFMKSKNKTSPVTNSSTTQTATKPLASPADVDTTNKELETSLSKIDESKDFPATDLSDKSLGL